MGDNLIEWDGGKAAAELLPYEERYWRYRCEAAELIRRKEEQGTYFGMKPYVSPRCLEVQEIADKWGIAI